jgi:hypothetical protein
LLVDEKAVFAIVVEVHVARVRNGNPGEGRVRHPPCSSSRRQSNSHTGPQCQSRSAPRQRFPTARARPGRRTRRHRITVPTAVVTEWLRGRTDARETFEADKLLRRTAVPKSSLASRRSTWEISQRDRCRCDRDGLGSLTRRRLLHE